MRETLDIKVPELRFPEFSGEWEEKRLGDEITLYNNKRIPLEKLERANRSGPYPYFGASGIIDSVDDFLFDGEYVLLAEDGANIVLRSSPLAFLAEGQFWVNNHAHVFQSHGSNKFLAEELERQSFVKYNTGTAQPKLNSKTLLTIKVTVPALPEQQKIAEFLTAVDEKIGKLKRKKELLEAYKKGAMQKLFSQEIRFKDDQGNPYPDWEEKRLGDIGSKSKRKNRANKSLPVLTNSAIQGVILQDSYFDREITTEGNLDGYYLVDLGLFIYNPRISKHAKAGPINLNNAGAGLMSPLYTVFSINKGLQIFFKEYFKTTFWHRYMMAVSNFGVRHDRMNVTNDDFFAMPLPYPSLPEQQKIAEFLTGIDDKVTAVANQIDQAAEFKKGLLQKMFV